MTSTSALQVATSERAVSRSQLVPGNCTTAMRGTPATTGSSVRCRGRNFSAHCSLRSLAPPVRGHVAALARHFGRAVRATTSLTPASVQACSGTARVLGKARRPEISQHRHDPAGQGPRSWGDASGDSTDGSVELFEQRYLKIGTTWPGQARNPGPALRLAR